MVKRKFDAKRRRALNIVWTASDDYRYSPDFLSFQDNGKPDLYLNAVVGFVDKWYDAEKLNKFFDEMQDSALKQTFDDLMWLGLENVTYAKEFPSRPVLASLRKEHARAYFQSRLMGRRGVAHDMQAARWHEVLGEKTELATPWDKKLYKELAFDPNWTTDEIIANYRSIIKRYFVSRFMVRESLEKVIIAGPLGKILDYLVPRHSYRQESKLNLKYGKKEAEEKIRGLHEINSPMDIITGNTAQENYAYILKCFGKPLYSAGRMLEIERELCTGPHRYSHLFFTRGGISGSKDAKQTTLMAQASLKQKLKNLAFYKEHSELYRKSINKLTGQIKNSMQLSNQPLAVPSKNGTFVAARVWRALYLNDNRVFYAKEETTSPDFTVDLMLDASASRGGSQKVIAAQAYVISESLRMCGIPSQIYSFCTLRGYTVLNIFKTYKENKRCANVFNYCATGWNRDGLAFRGARDLMGDETGSKKILIVLTDAQPNDDRSIVSESNPFLRHDYSNERAVADTAGEVASLRRENIRVIGLINDEIKGGMGDAKEIYGQDFVHVRDLEKMAESVGTLLARQIASL